jgi:iron only hydrogenase large subunit-like protein
LLSWLRKNGNCKIYDVGYGADICSYMHNKYLSEHPNAKLITQPCPAVVNYIQKYQPELIPYLSPVLSPVGCLAVWLRKYEKVTAPMFMLSPCIAKTSEAGREGLYDYNVTFKRLDRYVQKKKIDWDVKPDFKFDAVEGSIGRMYPMPSGLKETMLMLNPNLVIRNTEGIRELYPSLERYAETPDEKKPDILDVLNCRHGCNRGTALPEDDTTLLEVEQIMHTITEKSIHETRGGLFGIGKFKRFKEFDKILKLEDFLTSYKDESAHRPKLSSADYEEIFKQMHKYDFTSQNINCGACGYRHCRDMAYAIYYHMNVRENCVHYLKQVMKDEYAKLEQKYESAVEELKKYQSQ